jgi:hypothetical protein
MAAAMDAKGGVGGLIDRTYYEAALAIRRVAQSRVPRFNWRM